MKTKHIKLIHNAVEKEKNNIVNFLCDFINQKSINPDRALPEEPGEVASCQKWLKEKMEHMSIFDRIDFWEKEKGQPNLVGVISGTQDQPSIMFNGHVDVVPVTKKQYENWSVGSPWKAEVINGNVYGRGACDMKGGITSFLWAVKILRNLNIHIKGKIIVSINVGEESSNFDIGSESIVKRGYRASLLINAEPTNLIICPATMGSFFFKITVFGKTAHVAYNRQSLYPGAFGEKILPVNAIEKMKLFLNAYERLNHQWGLYRKHPLADPGSMNLCLVHIEGGTYLGSIPESCSAIYLVWFNPNLKSTEVMEEIKKVFKNVIDNDYWLKKNPPELEIPYLGADKNFYEPIDISVNHEGCIALSESYREIMREEPKFGCFPAVCDANLFFKLGIPSIIFGPGDLSMGAHGKDEHVPVEQVINATKIYANLIIKYLGMNENSPGKC